MTLGEIKAEALRLMLVDRELDGESVGDLELDEDYGMLYTGTVGAINRALADLEARRILPLKRAVLREPQHLVGAAVAFSLGGIADLSLPARLAVMGENYVDEDCPYVFEAGRLRVMRYDEGAVYELLYHPSPARVTHTTPNSTVLELPEVLAAALPYYVKADLYRADEPGEANDARNWYESAVAQYASLLHNGPQGSVVNVFEGVF